MCGRLKLDLCLSPITNINSKWIKDLNMRPEMMKQLLKVVGETLEHTSIGIDTLNITPMAQQLRERMNKWDLIKLKTFCTIKETVTRLKRLITELEKIFASYTSDIGLISRIYKKFKKVNH
jgi:hypothetical protein